MSYINLKINGVPYGKDKRRGNIEAPSEWTRAIEQQTSHCPKIKQSCILKVTFLLPPDKFPTDLPYGSDLDNLLKRFLDALNSTIFSDTMGNDSCVISMFVSKVKIDSQAEAGAILEIFPVTMG